MFEFNDKFLIYTTNEKFFYYLINPIFIEKLLRLENKRPGKIYFCITENMLHIGINDNSNIPQFDFKQRITSKIYDSIKDDISFVKDIINILGLDEIKFTDNFEIL